MVKVTSIPLQNSELLDKFKSGSSSHCYFVKVWTLTVKNNKVHSIACQTMRKQRVTIPSVRMTIRHGLLYRNDRGSTTSRFLFSMTHRYCPLSFTKTEGLGLIRDRGTRKRQYWLRQLVKKGIHLRVFLKGFIRTVNKTKHESEGDSSRGIRCFGEGYTVPEV